MNILIKSVGKEDYTEICHVLSNLSLPVLDLDSNLPHFFKTEVEGKIVGVIGLEFYSQYALLRSFAVIENYRNLNLGKMLLEKAMDYSVENKITDLYLLTTTAEKYFEIKGFSIISRDKVAFEIQESEQFKNTCPSSAIVLTKKLISYKL